MTDIKTLAREASAKLIPHTTSVHNVTVITDVIILSQESLIKENNILKEYILTINPDYHF